MDFLKEGFWLYTWSTMILAVDRVITHYPEYWVPGLIGFLGLVWWFFRRV